MVLQRHRIVWLDPAVIPGASKNKADEALLQEWVASGRPLIVRRCMDGDRNGSVPLGLPLPPAMGKRRIALEADKGAILRDAPPPLLADAESAAPAEWAKAIAGLLAIDRRVRCFGGLAWQHLTGLAYIGAGSDLDLLWRVASAAEADRLAEAVADIQANAPMLIDGEFAAPAGLAVHWREWVSGADELLAKARDGNRLAARAELFA